MSRQTELVTPIRRTTAQAARAIQRPTVVAGSRTGASSGGVAPATGGMACDRAAMPAQTRVARVAATKATDQSVPVVESGRRGSKTNG